MIFVLFYSVLCCSVLFCVRDLYLLFRKFGTILSVHTMINKTTGLSKGYGFVSYAGREEAKAAIAAMDGFRVSFLSSYSPINSITRHNSFNHSWGRSA